MDEALARILDDGYLDDLASLSVAELRARRTDCQTVENKLSYLRRLVQGRHDIVSGEISRRAGGGDPDDVADLVGKLPDILSDRIRGPGGGRMPTSFEPGELRGELVDRLEDLREAVPLDSPGSLPDADLAHAAEALADLEEEVSGLRRTMFDRIDTIENELVGRYRAGEARVDDLLSGR